MIKDKSQISCETVISHYQFHPDYSEILLSSLLSGKVNLWKLDDYNNTDINNNRLTINNKSFDIKKIKKF